MSEGGSTVISIRLPVALAEALRAEARDREQSLSALVRSLATDAGIGGAKGEPSRLTALERRVDALERAPTTAPPKRTPKAAQRAAAAPGTRKARATGANRPITRGELPEGFPATGAELGAWMQASGLSGKAFAKTVDRSRQALGQQTRKGNGDGPLSAGLALDLVAAVEAGRLPAPG